MKLRLLLVALVVAGLAAPSSAHAGWKMRRATAIANIVWNQPCDGYIARFWEPLDHVYATAHVGDCSVTFNTKQRWPWEKLCTIVIHEWGHHAYYRDPTNTTDPDHSSNPASVMYVGPGVNFEPVRGWVVDSNGNRHHVVDWSGTSMDDRCRENGRPYLERHGELKPRR